ncbi:hypothetical protein AGIG_G4959 [Arapaima gigas]
MKLELAVYLGISLLHSAIAGGSYCAAVSKARRFETLPDGFLSQGGFISRNGGPLGLPRSRGDPSGHLPQNGFILPLPQRSGSRFPLHDLHFSPDIFSLALRKQSPAQGGYVMNSNEYNTVPGQPAYHSIYTPRLAQLPPSMVNPVPSLSLDSWATNPSPVEPGPMKLEHFQWVSPSESRIAPHRFGNTHSAFSSTGSPGTSQPAYSNYGYVLDANVPSSSGLDIARGSLPPDGYTSGAAIPAPGYFYVLRTEGDPVKFEQLRGHASNVPVVLPTDQEFTQPQSTTYTVPHGYSTSVVRVASEDGSAPHTYVRVLEPVVFDEFNRISNPTAEQLASWQEVNGVGVVLFHSGPTTLKL